MSVQTKPTLVLGRPRFLFEGVYLRSVLALSYEVSADGQRFLMISDPPPLRAFISLLSKTGPKN